jgi:hypothetical protein
LRVSGYARLPRCNHALVFAASVVMTTPGTLPSDGVLRRRPRRYYDPLGLPLHRARSGTRPLRVASPRRGLCRRISRVPCLSLDACCAPYPAGPSGDHFGSSRHRCCLRRGMSGSASRLWMFRGCKLHFMLRPASLPPLAGLLTSRFGYLGLPRLRRPATRRSDAYRGGTFTRRRSAARPLASLVGPVGVVTAHHAAC